MTSWRDQTAHIRTDTDSVEVDNARLSMPGSWLSVDIDVAW